MNSYQGIGQQRCGPRSSRCESPPMLAVVSRVLIWYCSNMNMIQAIGWNSIERTASDWKRLFSSVDKRLRFLGTRTPPGCSVSLIKAEFHLGANGATTQ